MRRSSAVDANGQQRGSLKGRKSIEVLRPTENEEQLQKLRNDLEKSEKHSALCIRNLQAELDDAEATIAVTKESLARLVDEKSRCERQHEAELEKERAAGEALRRELRNMRAELEAARRQAEAPLGDPPPPAGGSDSGEACEGGRVAPPPQDALLSGVAAERSRAARWSRLGFSDSEAFDSESDVHVIQKESGKSSPSRQAVGAPLHAEPDHEIPQGGRQAKDPQPKRLEASAQTGEGRHVQEACTGPPEQDVSSLCCFDLAYGERTWDLEDVFEETWVGNRVERSLCVNAIDGLLAEVQMNGASCDVTRALLISCYAKAVCGE